MRPRRATTRSKARHMRIVRSGKQHVAYHAPTDTAKRPLCVMGWTDVFMHINSCMHVHVRAFKPQSKLTCRASVQLNLAPWTLSHLPGSYSVIHAQPDLLPVVLAPFLAELARVALEVHGVACCGAGHVGSHLDTLYHRLMMSCEPLRCEGKKARGSSAYL